MGNRLGDVDDLASAEEQVNDYSGDNQADNHTKGASAAFLERVEETEHGEACPVNRRGARLVRWSGRLRCYNSAAR